MPSNKRHGDGQLVQVQLLQFWLRSLKVQATLPQIELGVCYEKYNEESAKNKPVEKESALR